MPEYIVTYTSMTIEAEDADEAIEIATDGANGGGHWEAEEIDPKGGFYDFPDKVCDSNCGPVGHVGGCAAS